MVSRGIFLSLSYFKTPSDTSDISFTLFKVSQKNNKSFGLHSNPHFALF